MPQNYVVGLLIAMIIICETAIVNEELCSADYVRDLPTRLYSSFLGALINNIIVTDRANPRFTSNSKTDKFDTGWTRWSNRPLDPLLVVNNATHILASVTQAP